MDIPRSFYVTLGPDSNSHAQANKVEKGQSVSLIVENNKTFVQSIKVVRGKNEETMAPNAKLPIGKRYAIRVDPIGKVETALSDP